jgi:hypothetical protein
MDNFRLLRTGMNQVEVDALLGEPSWEGRVTMGSMSIWSDEDRTIVVHFSDISGGATGGHLEFSDGECITLNEEEGTWLLHLQEWLNRLIMK